MKSKQAGRSHKKGRTDYRLREGNPVNLRVGIKHRVIYSVGRSNANLLILTGLSECPQHRVEAGFLCVSVSAEDPFASLCALCVQH